MYWVDLQGGTRAKKILQGILFSKRIANAYLFTGFDTAVKLNHARFFGKTLLCLKQGVQPCGECIACQKFEKGVHPDFISIEPEGASLKIEQIRQLKKSLNYGPNEGNYLVVLVDASDTMTPEAANGFLKGLEEPVKGVVFILLAAREEGLPLTIVSRCQKIVFGEEVASSVLGCDFIDQLEAVEAKGVVAKMDLSETLLQIEAGPGEVILSLIAEQGKRLRRITDQQDLSRGIRNMRLLFDAFRKTNLHLNNRLLLESVVLKWGREYETFSN
ncbi:MAG: hypothetical protein NT099_07695 [Candidatus Saganbacteria bacterium]|nr:hypothetical protein [Candidatus Saganbacteria bacterium]